MNLIRCIRRFAGVVAGMAAALLALAAPRLLRSPPWLRLPARPQAHHRSRSGPTPLPGAACPAGRSS